MTKHPWSLDLELYGRVAWWLYIPPMSLKGTEDKSVDQGDKR